MRKRAFAEGAWDFANNMVNPFQIARNIGDNFYDAGTHLSSGNVGKSLLSATKGVIDLPMFGLAGGAARLGAKVLGKTMGAVGGKNFLGHAKVSPALGKATAWTGGQLDNGIAGGIGKATTTFNKAMPSAGKQIGSQVAVHGGEAGHGMLKSKLEHWSTPQHLQTGQDGGFMNNLRGQMAPNGNPMNAGHNVEFPS